MAATYPIEVVEAERWLQEPGNSLLNGDPLAAALQQKSWDPSVKSIIAFPQLLAIMNSNLQWTDQLGEAFITNQPAVMDSIQRLRKEALTAGTLASTPQQTVTSANGIITITPAEQGAVYVPYYNPATVYGTWPYPTYAPFAFPAPGYAYNQAAISYGTGIIIVTPLWGWHHCDWRHHRIDIDDEHFEHLGGRHRETVPGTWQHNPDHRHIPLNSPQMRMQSLQPVPASTDKNKKVIFLHPAGTPLQATPMHTVQQQHPVAPLPGTASHQPDTHVQPPATHIVPTNPQSGKIVIQPGSSNTGPCIGSGCNNNGMR